MCIDQCHKLSIALGLVCHEPDGSGTARAADSRIGWLIVWLADCVVACGMVEIIPVKIISDIMFVQGFNVNILAAGQGCTHCSTWHVPESPEPVLLNH